MSNIEMKFIDDRMSGIIELMEDTYSAMVMQKSVEEIDELCEIISNQFKDLCNYETGSVWPTEQYIRNKFPHLHKFFDALIKN